MLNREINHNKIGAMVKVQLTDKVIKRLTLYHCILFDYIEQNIEFISSPQIAKLLNIDDSQVRKDIKLLNNSGKCKVGYDVKCLKKSIEKTLGFENPKNAFIGLNIMDLFDNDKSKVDVVVNFKKVFDVEKLPDLAKKLNVEIAILTVPRAYAQETADFLIKSNIKYIWNFTPSVLKVAEDVVVWNENLIGNFLHFTSNYN